MSSSARSYLFAAAIGAACAGAALAEPATIVFAATAHAGTSGKDAVPGMPGFVFTNFSDAFGSSGTKWITAATISGPGSAAATDQVVLVGDGANFGVAAREGVTVVGDAGQLLNLSGLALPRINGAGVWAIAFLPAGTTTGLVVKSTNGVFSTVATGGAFSPTLGTTFGLNFASAAVLGDGTVGFLNDGVSGSPRTALSNDGAALVAREAEVTYEDPLPSGRGGLLRALSFATNAATLHITEDSGANLYLADVDTDVGVLRSVIKNRDIVLQVGQPLPNVPGESIATITEVRMEDDGSWFARGAGGGGANYALHNRKLIARIGDPILPDSTEVWTTIIAVRGDAAGNYAVVGTTSAASTSNDVIVLNGSALISRESDPVDLDGDGRLDDGLFIHSFRDRCFMSNDGYFYIGARMKNSAAGTSSLGANVSMVRIPFPAAPCPADFNQDGGVDGADVESFYIAWEAADAAADVNQDGGVDGGDVQTFFEAWEAGGCD